MSPKSLPENRIVLPNVRGSYVHVFTPRRNDNNGKEQYSMAVLIPKGDTKTIRKINALIDATAEDRWGQRKPRNLVLPLHDGDEKSDQEAYHGHYYINLKSDYQPDIVNSKREPVLNVKEFESGDYCNVSVTAFAYDNVNTGVSLALGNIQVLRKGEPLGNRRSAEDDFDDVWEDDDVGNRWD